MKIRPTLSKLELPFTPLTYYHKAVTTSLWENCCHRATLAVIWSHVCVHLMNISLIFIFLLALFLVSTNSAEQVVCSGFSRASSLNPAACCCWKPVRLLQNNELKDVKRSVELRGSAQWDDNSLWVYHFERHLSHYSKSFDPNSAALTSA